MGEQHAIAADRARIQKAVKPGDALDAGARQSQRLGEAGQGARRQPFETPLRIDEDLQQARRIAAMPRQRAVHGLVQIRYLASLERVWTCARLSFFPMIQVIADDFERVEASTPHKLSM